MGLAPIPLKTTIVDAAGSINLFFRERWEELRALVSATAAKGIYTASGQTAAIATGLIYTVLTPGLYEVTFTARRTRIDGAASTLTFTWHWTDGGLPLSDSAAANATDTTGSLYSGTRLLPVDANTPLTFDLGYTSTTPAQMMFKISVTAKLTVQA